MCVLSHGCTWPEKNPNKSQDAHETIELLENRLRNHESLPGGGGGAERDAEMHALHEEVAAKEKRIASLQVFQSI
jgi:hypothetical protein